MERFINILFFMSIVSEINEIGDILLHIIISTFSFKNIENPFFGCLKVMIYIPSLYYFVIDLYTHFYCMNP